MEKNEGALVGPSSPTVSFQSFDTKNVQNHGLAFWHLPVRGSI